jgi:MerR family copper efflux transcriptional regulator
MTTLNIGDAATASGVSAKMIRHYESLGLMPKARRTSSGYRMYDDTDVHFLRFIRRARDLGFSTKQISELLGLWRDRRRQSSKVKALASEHIRELEQKLLELSTMKTALEHLVHCCHGDDRPECPILENLSIEAETPRSTKSGIPRRGALPARPRR